MLNLSVSDASALLSLMVCRDHLRTISSLIDLLDTTDLNRMCGDRYSSDLRSARSSVLKALGSVLRQICAYDS